MDFFHNIAHLQLHRRTRALQRLAKVGWRPQAKRGRTPSFCTNFCNIPLRNLQQHPVKVISLQGKSLRPASAAQSADTTLEFVWMLLQALKGDGGTEAPALSVRVRMVVLVPLLQQFILEGRATEGSGHDTKQVCRW